MLVLMNTNARSYTLIFQEAANPHKSLTLKFPVLAFSSIEKVPYSLEVRVDSTIGIEKDQDLET